MALLQYICFLHIVYRLYTFLIYIFLYIKSKISDLKVLNSNLNVNFLILNIYSFFDTEKKNNFFLHINRFFIKKNLYSVICLQYLSFDYLFLFLSYFFLWFFLLSAVYPLTGFHIYFINFFVLIFFSIQHFNYSPYNTFFLLVSLFRV